MDLFHLGISSADFQLQGSSLGLRIYFPEDGESSSLTKMIGIFLGWGILT